MILKKFNDNYDAEFVNLMLDIQNLIQDFCKSDKLKINSWAKILCVPTINIEFKKNRNLYAIKLLDNVLNGKLEDPFNKFAKDKELKKLNPILVKTQLTPKFLKEIKKFESNDNYLHLENPDSFEFNNPYNKEIPNSNRITKKNTQNNFYKNNLQRKNFQNKKLLVDYDNQFLLIPGGHKRSKSSYKVSKIKLDDGNYIFNNNYDMNGNNLRPSDILLIKNFGNFPYRNNSHLLDFRNNYKYNRYEKYKLKSIADRLNYQRLENNEIILNQKNEIDKLKRKISQMQLKIKKIYDSQK